MRIRKTSVLIFIIGLTSGWLLGRHYHPSSRELKSEIKELKCGITLLEEHLLDCWNDLPLGCIRHGSVDY